MLIVERLRAAARPQGCALIVVRRGTAFLHSLGDSRRDGSENRPPPIMSSLSTDGGTPRSRTRPPIVPSGSARKRAFRSTSSYASGHLRKRSTGSSSSSGPSPRPSSGPAKTGSTCYPRRNPKNCSHCGMMPSESWFLPVFPRENHLIRRHITPVGVEYSKTTVDFTGWDFPSPSCGRKRSIREAPDRRENSHELGQASGLSCPQIKYFSRSRSIQVARLD
jgi:hypothetical protein